MQGDCKGGKVYYLLGLRAVDGGGDGCSGCATMFGEDELGWWVGARGVGCEVFKARLVHVFPRTVNWQH